MFEPQKRSWAAFESTEVVQCCHFFYRGWPPEKKVTIYLEAYRRISPIFEFERVSPVLFSVSPNSELGPLASTAIKIEILSMSHDFSFIADWLKVTSTASHHINFNKSWCSNLSLKHIWHLYSSSLCLILFSVWKNIFCLIIW